MHMSTVNKWRLMTYVIVVGIWAAVVALYLAIAQMAGGTTALLDTVYGGSWSAFTLIILGLGLLAIGLATYWLSETERPRKMSVIWAVVSVILVLVIAVVGLKWVTWAWSIFWTIPLAIPLLLGAGATLWLIEAKPRPDSDEEEEEDLRI